MAPKTAWDCPRSSYPQRLSRVQDTIAPVEVQRQRVPHRNIASLQSLAWWNAPWCHTLRKFQLFRFTHPFTPLVKNRRWWKRQQKKGAKLIATVPSLTKVQAMDSVAIRKLWDIPKLYRWYCQSHQISNIPISCGGDWWRTPLAEWGHKNRLNKNFCWRLWVRKAPTIF